MTGIIRTLAAGLAVMAMAAAPATTAAPARPLAQTAEIDAVVTRALERLDGVPGIAVAVYTPEGTYARGFGYADVERGLRADADTAFYIASSTKSFTALAMAALEAKGRIDLDQTVSAYAPDAPFPAAAGADRARLRDLLTHTSGMDNGPIGFRSLSAASTTARPCGGCWARRGPTPRPRSASSSTPTTATTS